MGDKGLQPFKAHFERSIVSLKGSFHVRRQNKIVSLGMLPPEGFEIRGIEVVGGPFTFDRERIAAARSPNKIDLMAALIPPIIDVARLRPRHDFVQHEMLP